MLCLKTRPFSLTFSSPKHSIKPYSHSSKSSLKMSSSSQTIEHIVLFKVKPNTDPTNLSSMLTGLSSLLSLSQVRHLTVGPILQTRSSSFTFTHLLHSRYNSKDDLASYSAHPDHVSVVKGSVLPICDDIMAVDWVAHDLNGSDLVLHPGSALKVSFLKLKEGLGDGVRDEVLGVVGGIKDRFGGIRQFSYGENFSPARAKGFSIASIAVFDGKEELDGVDSDKGLVDHEKGKVREYLDGVLVLDYVVPSPQARPANL